MHEFTYTIPSKREDEYTALLTAAGIDSFCFEKMKGALFLKIYSESAEPCGVIDRSMLTEVKEIHEADWKNKWTEGYTGHELTADIYVLPPGVDPPVKSYRHMILIDPEDSFGDGHHPTTRLCGEMLEHVLLAKGECRSLSLVDIGTGSGVLAIAAYIMGVMDIELFDYDSCSVVKADKNLCLNGIHGIKATLADLYTFTAEKKYDIVTANLLSKIIEDNLARLKSLLKPDGIMILSGIGSIWGGEMAALFEKSGLRIIIHKKLEEWEGFALGLKS